MTTTHPTFDVLQSCQQDGLLSADEITQASTHTHYGQIMPTSDHVGVLVWLVQHQILTEEELRQRGAAFSASLLASLNAANPNAGVKVQTPVDAALDVLALAPTRPSLGVLKEQGLITQGEWVLALANCGDSEKDFDSPAFALGWMMVNRFISPEREAELSAQAATATPERAAVLEEARRIANVVTAGAMAEAESGGLIAGLVLCVGVLALAGVIAWWLF